MNKLLNIINKDNNFVKEVESQIYNCKRKIVLYKLLRIIILFNTAAIITYNVYQLLTTYIIDRLHLWITLSNTLLFFPAFFLMKQKQYEEYGLILEYQSLLSKYHEEKKS